MWKAQEFQFGFGPRPANVQKEKQKYACQIYLQEKKEKNSRLFGYYTLADMYENEWAKLVISRKFCGYWSVMVGDRFSVFLKSLLSLPKLGIA